MLLNMTSPRVVLTRSSMKLVRWIRVTRADGLMQRGPVAGAFTFCGSQAWIADERKSTLSLVRLNKAFVF